MNDWLLTSLVLIGAYAIDRLFGEPGRFHPLVGFGNLAARLERQLNKNLFSVQTSRLFGALAWGVMVLPLPLGLWWWQNHWLGWPNMVVWCDLFLVYICLGNQSLRQHAYAIYQPLTTGDIQSARQAVQMIVSRRTDSMDESQINRATVESVLENGHDAVIATLFWYMIGGAPLVVLHRLVNTLDAMWGYKNARFTHFGWLAAKSDDWLGWLSAKVTGVLYWLSQSWHPPLGWQMLKTALYQSRQYKSLNGGWVMAIGAFVLQIKLGGKAQYEQQWFVSVELGEGEPPTAQHIVRAVSLVNRAFMLFVSGIAIIGMIEWIAAR
ncbi:adenosylcobinamide-phosphate synthase CbiB [Aliikangiella maris]|uniref:Adenosylcobinamide-phosphate synthase CbiB n=2 Tax=Aliikangiella maris TaxID=3162458 RepID=A0ABV2BW79_9GAMM